MNKKRWFAFSLIVVVAVGTAWATGYLGESQLDQVRANAREMFSEENRDLSDDERRKQREDFRAQVESLSEEDRRELFNDWRKRSMEQFEQRVDNLLAMTDEERNEALDEQIDREEDMRERWQERRNNAESQGDGARGGGDRGRRWRGGGDAQSRNERGREMLDATSPEFRAKMTEYRRLVKQRREERGLPPSGGFWGGHRGPRSG